MQFNLFVVLQKPIIKFTVTLDVSFGLQSILNKKSAQVTFFGLTKGKLYGLIFRRALDPKPQINTQKN